MTLETRGIFPLEIRARGRTITGAFPYKKTATLRMGGRRRLEMFAPGAFAASLREGREIHLLADHSFGAPLASRGAGSLVLTDTPEALEFTATLPEADSQTTAMRDTVAALSAGLIAGISPGFVVPAGGEDTFAARGQRGEMIRRINRAELHELSIVVRPAYAETEIDLRSGVTGAGDFRRRRLWL